MGEDLDAEDGAQLPREDDLKVIAQPIAGDDDGDRREGPGGIALLDLADQSGEPILQDREVVVSLDRRHGG